MEDVEHAMHNLDVVRKSSDECKDRRAAESGSASPDSRRVSVSSSGKDKATEISAVPPSPTHQASSSNDSLNGDDHMLDTKSQGPTKSNKGKGDTEKTAECNEPPISNNPHNEQGNGLVAVSEVLNEGQDKKSSNDRTKLQKEHQENEAQKNEVI